MEKKYKICIYAICKNEEKFIDRWFNSVKEADEIYVLDTGSTDNSVNKLKKLGVLHCCPFNPELVKHGLEAGLYIAFGGTCTFKSSKNAPKIVEMVPIDRMLIETDAPYLAPEPVRGTRNDSSNLKYIVKKLAEFKGVEPDVIAKATFENATKLFLENK